MNDLIHRKPDKFAQIQGNLRRLRERQLLEELMSINLGKFAEGPTQQTLLHLQSKARRYLRESS